MSLSRTTDDALNGRLARDLKDTGLDFFVLKSDRIWDMSPEEKQKYFP